MRLVTPLDELSEADWQRQVVDLAQSLGYRHYHTHDSRRSPHGFPDLVLVKASAVFLELKTEAGKATEDQLAWIAALQHAGQHAYVCRPRHLDELAALLTRGVPGTSMAAETAALLRGRAA